MHNGTPCVVARPNGAAIVLPLCKGNIHGTPIDVSYYIYSPLPPPRRPKMQLDLHTQKVDGIEAHYLEFGDTENGDRIRPHDDVQRAVRECAKEWARRNLRDQSCNTAPNDWTVTPVRSKELVCIAVRANGANELHGVSECFSGWPTACFFCRDNGTPCVLVLPGKVPLVLLLEDGLRGRDVIGFSWYIREKR